MIKKDILVLGKCSSQRLDDTKITAEAEYSMNFLRSQIFLKSFPYNQSNSSLFVNVLKLYQYKAKNPEIKPNSFIYFLYLFRSTIFN